MAILQSQVISIHLFTPRKQRFFLKNQIDESLKKLINIYFNLSYMFKSGRVSPKFSLLYTSLLFFFFITMMFGVFVKILNVVKDFIIRSIYP